MSQLERGDEWETIQEVILKTSIQICCHKAMWSVASCLAPQTPVRQPSYKPSVQASMPPPSVHTPSSPARLGRTCLLPLLLWICASFSASFVKCWVYYGMLFSVV